MAAWRGFGPVAMAGLAAYTLAAALLGRRERQATATPGTRAAQIQRAAAGHRPVPRTRRNWWAILKRTANEIVEDNLSMVAASVAFYALMALFPGLAALVSLYGLMADPGAIQSLFDMLQGLLPTQVAELIAKQLAALVAQPRSGLSLAGIGALLLALFSARSGAGAIMTALTTAYDEVERRSFLRFNLQAMVITIATILFVIVALICLALWPAVAEYLPIARITKEMGFWLRWPLLAVLVMLVISMLYRFGPSRPQPCWQLMSWGAGLAGLLWLAGSAGFTFYLARFGSYDKTYGSIGAVVALLMWLWLSSFILLAGAELNRQIERMTGDCPTG